MLRSLPRVLVVYDLEVCSSDLQLDSRLRSEECGETKLLPREPRHALCTQCRVEWRLVDAPTMAAQRTLDTLCGQRSRSWRQTLSSY